MGVVRRQVRPTVLAAPIAALGGVVWVVASAGIGEAIVFAVLMAWLYAMWETERKHRDDVRRQAARDEEERAAEVRRLECARDVAGLVRGILDQPVDLTRTDRVHFGDYLSLRRLATRAQGDAITTFAGAGGPAQTFAEVLSSLASHFETEVHRCYMKMRLSDQSRIDRFAKILKAAAAASEALIAVPSGDDYASRCARLYSELATALVAIVEQGDGLDREFDPVGSEQAASVRNAAAATRRAGEWDAAEVLLANARKAESVLFEKGAPAQDTLEDLSERVRSARDIGLHVDSVSYQGATDEVRAAHHRVVYEDLFDALELIEQLRRGEVDVDKRATVDEVLGRVSSDVAHLDELRGPPGSR